MQFRAVLLVAMALPWTARLAAGQGPTQYPLTITNCNASHTYAGPPKRAVTLNQGATEVMLALGLEKYIAATAYLDDVISDKWKQAYLSVNTTFRQYPTAGQLAAAKPDFLYASYRSAFSTASINYTGALVDEECSLVVDNSTSDASCRAELNRRGIGTYLQEHACELVEHRKAATTLEDLESEVRTIGRIFNASSNAEALIAQLRRDFDLVSALEQQAHVRQPLRALWLDSYDPVTPFIGACCGAPALIMRKAGLQNIADDIGVDTKSTWASVNWTDIIARKPDVIVLVDASWDTATDKLVALCNESHPASALAAVRGHKFISIPFSASTLGVKIGDAAINLAVGVLSELGLGPSANVSSTMFSTVEEVRQGFRMAFTGTGVGFFLAVPEPLQAVCPLRLPSPSTSAAAAAPASSDGGGDDGLPAGAIAGIAVACAVGVAALVVAGVVVYKLRRLRREYDRLMTTGSVGGDSVAHVTTKGAVTLSGLKAPMNA